jgi:hypothetical protein
MILGWILGCASSTTADQSPPRVPTASNMIQLEIEGNGTDRFSRAM